MHCKIQNINASMHMPTHMVVLQKTNALVRGKQGIQGSNFKKREDQKEMLF